MVEKNNNNSDMQFKIESELFALVKSLTNLNNKYQKGIVNDNFFRKALKSAMNNFLKLSISIKENHFSLPDLLKTMNLSQEYDSVLDLINKVSTLNLSDNITPSKHHTFLELPSITSEITSSFITLMDALTLDGITKKEFIFNLFNELNHKLAKFPGLDDILYKVELVQQNAVKQIDHLPSDMNLKEKLIDDLYQLFKEFQNKLNLKP